MRDAEGPQTEQSYHVPDIGHIGNVRDAFLWGGVPQTDKDHPRLWASYDLGTQGREMSNPLKKMEGRRTSWKTSWRRFQSRVEEQVICRLCEAGGTTLWRLRGCETGQGD